MHGSTTITLQAIRPCSNKDNQQQSSKSQHTNIKQANINLYFFIDDLKKLHQFIKAKHVEVTDLIFTDYRMLECTLFDPEGNTITLGMAETNNQN